jgi:exo-beta-1,3-glucanase (GH17 family)
MPLHGILWLALLGAGPEPPRQPDFEANRARFNDKLTRLRWIDYNPSTFDPKRKAPIGKAEIEADLKALVHGGFEPAKTGLCTYSCSPATGHEQIPRIARELGFGGVILGVWTINNADENTVARKLAREGLVDSICCGNEGLDDRYTWDELHDAMKRMRTDTNLPVSTSEQIDDYGEPNLTDAMMTDFVYPNNHPLFRGHDADPLAAAKAAHSIAAKLVKRTKLPVLIHETGWPSRGLDEHTPDKQRDFWSHLLKLEAKSGPRFVLFEAFDQGWKSERYRGVDIGPSWGLFSSDREPKCVVQMLRHDAQKTRE